LFLFPAESSESALHFVRGGIRSIRLDFLPANPTDPPVLFWEASYEGLSLGHSSNQAFVYDNVISGAGSRCRCL